MQGDADLVQAAQGGDEDAFGALVERHWARLVSFARSMVGEADAEDAVQEGFVVAWRKLSSLRSPEAFGAWMMRLLARSCWRRSKKQRSVVPLEVVAEPVDPASERAQGDLDVERLLRMLAPRQRSVMFLTVVEGMSDREIGEVLGINAGSVRAHRFQAREHLRRVLAGDGGQGNG